MKQSQQVDFNKFFEALKPEKPIIGKAVKIINGNTFYLANDSQLIRVRGLDELTDPLLLENLIWLRDVEVEKLYFDHKINCVVANVKVNEIPLPKLVDQQYNKVLS